MRHPLARALHGAGWNSTDVAGRLGVDPKTVQRWLAGRVPYPRYRSVLCALTGWRERDLWPQLGRSANPEPTDGEVRVVYPCRSQAPVDLWSRLFARAEGAIDILAYSGLFLAEDAAVQRLLRAKARAGTRVRLMLGDPGGRWVGQRGAEEGIDEIMAMRVHNALLLYQPLARERGIQLRLHDTVLYSSIYRADDELLVNAHVYGTAASYAPVLHLRRTRGAGMAANYLEAIEQVWERAREP